MNQSRAQAIGGAAKAGQILTWRATAGRSRFVLFCLMAALLAVLIRAFVLQHLHVEQWQKRAENRYERIRELPAARGRLLDRHGAVIAVSIPENRLGIVPSLFRVEHPKFPELAKLIGQKPEDLKRQILAAKRFFYLPGGLNLDITDRIRALGLPGIELEQEFHRHYPLGETFANLIGFTDVDERGQEGLERAFDTALRGRAGVERVLVDRRNQVFGQKQAQSANPGGDLQLSLDANLQAITHMAVSQALQTHRAKGAAAVMVDTRTGEVLAMANAPSFNPNVRVRLDPNRVRNRAVADSFEPGSTLKPFVIAAALDAGQIRPSSKIQTAPGAMTISGRTIRDAHAHGLLTVTEVLQKSSNIGTAKIALDLPSQVIYDRYRSLGFGAASPVSLPGAVSGRLRPWQSWVQIDKATISYGHGIAVSLVQVARAYTVFARQGDLVDLTLRPVEGPVEGQTIFTPRLHARFDRCWSWPLVLVERLPRLRSPAFEWLVRPALLTSPRPAVIASRGTSPLLLVSCQRTSPGMSSRSWLTSPAQASITVVTWLPQSSHRSPVRACVACKCRRIPGSEWCPVPPPLGRVHDRPARHSSL